MSADSAVSLAGRREMLVAQLKGDVLEIGASSGLSIRRYQAAASITLLEPTPGRRLATRASASPIPARVIAGPAENIPLPDDSVDHVVSSLVLCSVRDLRATLAEIRRVLRPRGTLEFIEHSRARGRMARWQDRMTPVQRLVSSGCNLNRDIPLALREAGFDLTTADYFTLSYGNPLMRPAIQGRAVVSTEVADPG